MLEIEIPGFRILKLHSLVLDYNGTMALDGLVLPSILHRLERVSELLTVYVVTADTFGKATPQLRELPCCQTTILRAGDQALAKLEIVQQLEANRVVAVGNGRNDARMLKEAGLGVAVVQEEGAAFEAIEAADIVCPSIEVALDLLLNLL